ncbi:hypothetical protein ACFQ0P_03045 [Microbacterium insulae]|uniref:Uncharacterized protein n=1 Tax=Microbacterium insulae TaxID=483014 RepID=A0ABW3AEE4_9MICO
MDRDLPEGVIDADPPGGWDEVGDGETAARNESADAEQPSADAGLAPDDPVEGEIARQSADPDLASDTDRGEEEP